MTLKENILFYIVFTAIFLIPTLGLSYVIIRSGDEPRTPTEEQVCEGKGGIYYYGTAFSTANCVFPPK